MRNLLRKLRRKPDPERWGHYQDKRTQEWLPTLETLQRQEEKYGNLQT